MSNRVDKNVTFILACTSVGLSSVFQFFILSVMQGCSPADQTFACFMQDLLLFLAFDIMRTHIRNHKSKTK